MAFEALISSMPKVSGAVFHLEGSNVSITANTPTNFTDIAVGILLIAFALAIISGCIRNRSPQTLVRNDVESPAIPNETNEETSDCLVFILFRAKQNVLAKGIRRFADLPKFEHWALGFQFSPGRLILVEMSNRNMTVIPRYIPETNQSYLECQFDHVKELEHVHISPKKIHDIVATHPDNSTNYKWVSNDCQTYVIKVMDAIDPKLVKKLNEIGYKPLCESAIGTILRSSESFS